MPAPPHIGDATLEQERCLPEKKFGNKQASARRASAYDGAVDPGMAAHGLGLKQQRRAQIIEALKANPNAKAVAEELGCAHYKTVWKIAKQNGIELTAGKEARGYPKIPSEVRTTIIRALKNNPNATAVAREVGGVGHQMVGNIAKAEGIRLTPRKEAKGRPKIPSEVRTKIIDALKANPNAKAVAKESGNMSYATIYRIAKAAGIELTAGKEAGGRPSAKHIVAPRLVP